MAIKSRVIQQQKKKRQSYLGFCKTKLYFAIYYPQKNEVAVFGDLQANL